MVLKKQLILAPALVLTSALLLAGCSSPAESPTPSPGDSSSSTTPSPQDTESQAPIAEGEPTPGGDQAKPDSKIDESAVVEGNIPTGGAEVIGQVIGEDGSSVVYTFSGDATNISALQSIFENNGFKWNPITDDNSSVIASGPNSNLSIEDKGDGTYTYTVFKGE